MSVVYYLSSIMIARLRSSSWAGSVIGPSKCLGRIAQNLGLDTTYYRRSVHWPSVYVNNKEHTPSSPSTPLARHLRLVISQGAVEPA